MTTVEDKFEEFRGRYVNVSIHMLSHEAKPRQMMYAGNYNFITSREEDLHGAVTFNGFSRSEHEVNREDWGRDGEVFVLNSSSIPSSVPKLLDLNEEQLRETKELWEYRHMKEEEGLPF